MSWKCKLGFHKLEKRIEECRIEWRPTFWGWRESKVNTEIVSCSICGMEKKTIIKPKKMSLYDYLNSIKSTEIETDSNYVYRGGFIYHKKNIPTLSSANPIKR